MTDRAEIVATITHTVENMTFAPQGSLVVDQPLLKQAGIDSLDLVEIAMALEEEFPALCQPDWRFEPQPDWSIEKFADVVIEQIAKEAARQ